MSESAPSPRMLLSIRAQLILAVVALVAGIVVFQQSYYPSRIAATALDSLHVKAFSVTRVAAHNVGGSLERDDADAVRQVFEGVATDPDFAYIVLLRPDGSTMAGIRPERMLPHQPHDEHDGPMARGVSADVLHIEVPVTTDRGARGHLLAGFSTTRIRTQLAENRQTTTFASLIIFLIGLIVAVGLGTSYGTTLQRIARQAQLAARGEIRRAPLDVGRRDELGQTAAAFDDLMAMMGRLQDQLKVVASGDLTQDTGLEGELAGALDQMVRSQRALVREIQETSGGIRAVSQEISATAGVLESGAVSQSSVVEQTLATVEALVGAATMVTDSSGSVLVDAEQAREKSIATEQRINELAQHTQRIGEFLDVIKEIGAKSEILALNAALEGVRAGEAGRGFSHVASEMQKLTQNVLEAVDDIEALTHDIDTATEASVAATQDVRARAESTAKQARQISTITRNQQIATTQLNASMAEMSEAIRQSVAASAQSASAAGQLSELSERLEDRVRQFHLDDT